MYSSDELLEALRRRTRRSLRPARPPGEFPPGWQAWFAAMRERVGLVTGASNDAMIAILIQREPRLPPSRMAALNRWQSFATLWRQEWQPPEPEGRRERIAAYAITLVIHLLLAVILLWLAWVRISSMPVPGPQGELVVQVEYIGEGTPQEEGGGAPSTQVPEPQEAAPSSSAASAASQPQAEIQPETPRVSSASPPAPAVEPQPTPPQPPPTSPVQAQPLEVTQTPQPDSDFTLAAPTPSIVSVPQAQVQVPELQEPVRVIEIVEIPRQARVEALQPELPSAQVAIPQLQAEAEALPDPQPALKPVRARQVSTPQAQVQAPELRDQVAALPSPAAGAGQGRDATSQSDGDQASTARSTGSTPGANAARQGGPPTTGDGSSRSPDSAGAGPRPATKPGAWTSTQPGDDWGLSDRNRPGGQAGKPGLFDEQGRPRLPPGSSPEAGGGLPPGMIDENIANLDRAGTWLKRPPIDYTPTRFDRFWVPHETLLQEWVRRNIREVSISIPGTSKKLRCVISVLQLGGGCGINDPNMQDNPATARPPPDIPFKPELQEDQDSLAKPAATTP